MQKIKTMNAIDADALQTMPIEDTTESIKTKHESAEPGAMLNRATRYTGEAQARAPTQHRSEFKKSAERQTFSHVRSCILKLFTYVLQLLSNFTIFWSNCLAQIIFYQ